MAGCPVCTRPLPVGTSVVYKGDELIHAGCWGDKPDAAGKPASLKRPAAGRKAAPTLGRLVGIGIAASSEGIVE